MKTKLFSRILLFSFLFGLSNLNKGLLAGQSDPGILTVKKCQDFKISGDGSAQSWGIADWINIPQRSTSGEQYTTKAKVLYSITGMYFLFDCEDKKLTSTMKADNLNLWEEDVVEVFLWTDESFPVYFEYEISPFNFELPIIVPNYKGSFYGWLPWHYEGDRKTQHATSVSGGKKESGSTVKGWKAEFFIPYTLLIPLNQVPPASGIKWRANMYRIDYDNGMKSFSWQKTEKNFHDYNHFGTFVFE